MGPLLNLLLVLLLGQGSGHSPELAKVRKLYMQAARAEDKAAVGRLSAQLKGHTGADPVLRAYYGSVLALKARDMVNPVGKVKAVKVAQRELAAAVAAAPANAEVRWLRYALERNLPGFLGMSDHLDEDRRVIFEQLRRHACAGLATDACRMLREYFLTQEKPSADEQKVLRAAAP